jgi:hypothetical protein
MLCNPADLVKKSIPGDLKRIETSTGNLYRDFTIMFVMADFRNTLKQQFPDISSLISQPEQTQTFSLGERLPLEGVLLLPCLYNEQPSPPRTA